MSEDRLRAAIMFRAELQAQYLATTCLVCGERGMPEGVFYGEGVDCVCLAKEPCSACGSRERFTPQDLDALRTDQIDLYTEHQIAMTQHLRQGLKDVDLDYSPVG